LLAETAPDRKIIRMSDSTSASDPLAGASREEIMSGLFANMVLQQTSMALMFLGKTPHPQSGKAVHDPEAAQIFIDQLEMLEVKTRGNLTPEEAGLLRQSLMTVRMAFVEAVNTTGQAPAAPGPTQPTSAPPSAPPPAQPATSPPASPPAAEESRKKFTKKY
jgi:hypothetical protein